MEAEPAMVRSPDEPVGDPSDAEVTRCRGDGVVCSCAIPPTVRVGKMAQAIDATVADPPPIVAAFSRQQRRPAALNSLPGRTTGRRISSPRR